MSFYFLFFTILLHHTDEQPTTTALPSEKSFVADIPYDELLRMVQHQEISNKQQELIMKSWAEEFWYNQRFFENGYMIIEFVDKYPNYVKIRDDFIENVKLVKYIALDPRLPRFDLRRFSELTSEEQKIEKEQFSLDKRLDHRDKWPVFLKWFLAFPKDWENMSKNAKGERLKEFYSEYQNALKSGLTMEIFSDCIVTAWNTAITLERLPDDGYDLSKIFEKFLRVTNPDHVETQCSALLKRVFAKHPLSQDEKKAMKDWVVSYP